MQYNNPIIPGFNPDPSICRVGEDFYLITSSFEFFPGVPIYHSKNLVNWKLINYCLTRESQLPLHNCNPSGGIFAPTIRYHDGYFFMVTTNVTNKGNFIVHTKDIVGEWSEPAWVKQRGIDPSLFWDDDGTCYFVSTASDTNHWGIHLSKIDPFSGELLSPCQLLTYGCGDKCTEAPHIYKRGDWYYLMIAEGSTEYGHMEKILRSKDIFGPYEECPRNPIITHVRGGDCRIQATGHADLVEDQNGNWWMVCLGIRPFSAYFHNLGRETFLTPMYWDDDDWPVIGRDGHTALVLDGPLPGPGPTEILPSTYSFNDDFNTSKLDLRWNFVRNPSLDRYILGDSKITLIGNEVTLSTPGGRSPTMIATRQQAFKIEITAKMIGDIALGQSSGITTFYNQQAHYEILVTREEDGYYVCLRKQVYEISVITDRQKIDYNGSINLRIITGIPRHTFLYEKDGEWITLGKGITAALCSETNCACSFTGCYIGMFTENGTISFDSFKADIKDEKYEK